jgi:membrane protein insertase Oxa1/YidC/SpoIIIJ
MLRIPTMAALAPRVAARKMANSRSVKGVARASVPTTTMAKSSLNAFSLPFYRLYTTPVTTGATAAAASATTSISTAATSTVTTSATTAAATAGAGFWSKLFFATKYSTLAPGFWTYAIAPVYGVAAIMEAVQISTGMPWWAVIGGTAVLLRIALTPLVIQQMKNAVIMERLQPKIEKVKQEMMAEMARMQAAGEKGSGASSGETEISAFPCRIFS